MRIPLIILLLALCSCSKQQNGSAPVVKTGVVLTDLDLVGVMRQYHVIPFNGFATSDSRYALPPEDWVTGEFLDRLRSFQFSLKQTHYAAESNDCDDFAKMAAAFARLVHGNEKHERGTSIAVGEFYYKIDGGGNHAINFAVVQAKDGRVKLIFLEPQTWAIVRLSESEVESCLNWIL